MNNNIPQCVLQRLKCNLHLQPNHPLCIIKNKIYDFFGKEFAKFDHLDRQVSVTANFDDLLIPSDHPCRRPTDTYYVDEKTVLRTQTSAHQTELLRKGFRQFLVTGDVYRKDEIDKTHFPVFHQMEGVACLADHSDPEKALLDTMKNLTSHLFPDCEVRINKDYFPFTHPSFEIEVFYQGKWLEVAGCGVIQPKILENCQVSGQGWAFGLGLERLAMILFEIPDIRLFWSTDPKFLNQFFTSSGTPTKFHPFSNLPSISKDISFFIPGLSVESSDQWPQINDFYDICRDVDLNYNMIEKIERFDVHTHPHRGNLVSHAYHIYYSAVDNMSDPGTFNSLANKIQNEICSRVKEKLSVIMRS